MPWTIGSILDRTTLPRLESEILLAHCLGLKRIDLFIHYQRELKEEELARLKALILRRKQYEPVAYITGTQPFMSLEFEVNRSVLIPRPETEELVEKAIDITPHFNAGNSNPKILDLGTGSGCIAVSLAKFLPNVSVVGIDASAEAIELARKNAARHKVAERCEFVHGDLFKALRGTQKFDLIVSNPPYISTEAIEKLENDVRIWEPHQALDGGKDGLDYIRKIIEQAPEHLKDQGRLLIEIGYDQGKKARELAEKNGRYNEIKIIRDLQKNDRILYLSRRRELT